jgi:hypothetical protein
MNKKNIFLKIFIIALLLGFNAANAAISYKTSEQATLKGEQDKIVISQNESLVTDAVKEVFVPLEVTNAPIPGVTACPCYVGIPQNTMILPQCTAEIPDATKDKADINVACATPKVVGSFYSTGPTLAQKLNDAVTGNIRSSGEHMVEITQDNGNQIVSKIQDVTAKLTESIATVQTVMSESKVQRSENLTNIKMNYLAELKEREIRAKNSEFGLDDTAEEIRFIEYQLEQERDNGVDKPQIVISKLKRKYDDNNFTLPIKIRSSDRVTPIPNGEPCEDYDPANINDQTGCFYYQKSQPGKKLEMIFNECSRAKKQTLMAMNQKSSSRVVSKTLKQEQTKSTGAVVTTSNIVNSQSEQRKVSCNDKEYGFNLCADDLEPNEYIEKVVLNEIIPNGNISATNLLTPPAVGSYDGETDLSGEELISSLISSLEKDNTAISENTPPLIHTYKTSSQYFAAKDYINNILNRYIVSNQSVSSRQNVSSAKFQSKFNQRQAALSLSEQVLNSAIEKRIGSKIKDAINDGSLERDDVVRESLSGAGYLDVLEDMVEEDYSKLVVGANTGQPTTEALSRMAPKNIKNWQYSAQVLNTKLKLENKMDDEQIELLLSTYLSLSVNSPNNIEFLEQMKVK